MSIDELSLSSSFHTCKIPFSSPATRLYLCAGDAKQDDEDDEVVVGADAVLGVALVEDGDKIPGFRGGAGRIERSCRFCPLEH